MSPRLVSHDFISFQLELLQGPLHRGAWIGSVSAGLPWERNRFRPGLGDENVVDVAF